MNTSKNVEQVSEQFVERFSELLDEAGTNAFTVSKEIGCGNSTLSHYLTKRHLPKLNIAIKLADYFNCTVDYLLGRKDENEATKFNPCPDFGTRFDNICKELDVSRYRLHEDTKIAESVMRYWIQGKTKPSVFNIIQIADALNVSIDYLIGREV